MAEQAYIARKLRCALRNAGEHLQDSEVDLAGVGLAADGLTGLKAHLRCDAPLKLLDLFCVPVEQLKEACAGAGRALAAEKLQLRELEVELLDIKQQVVYPKAGALADGRRLGGLKMRVGKSRQGFVFLCKLTQRRNGVHKELADDEQPAAHTDDVRIVADVAARRAEVDDGLCLGAALAEGQHVRHNVVPYLVLMRGSSGIVNVVNMRAHLIELLVADIESQLLLTLGEREPQPAPSGELVVVRKLALHLLVGIAAAEGVFVKFVHGKVFLYQPLYVTSGLRLCSLRLW